MNDAKKWEWLGLVAIIPWPTLWYPVCAWASIKGEPLIQLVSLGIQIGLLVVQLAALAVWFCKVYRVQRL